MSRVVLAEALAGEPVEASSMLELEPRPRVVREAREFVLKGSPPVTEATREVLLLLTSELVTNAVIHARTVLVVGVTVSASFVLVTVQDLDLGRQETAPHDREGGRGLTLVQAMADASALTPEAGGGKTAWFRVRRSAHSAGLVP